MLAFVARRARRPGLHHHHRVRPRHPQRQHHHHRPRRPLGLAQLYQLRGRVGRSSRRAYAYLLYRRRGQLTEVARKRLQAIFNASELGAGFQIALRDLEIRGAGNLLGAEQHGHIAAVGFDLYTQPAGRGGRGAEGRWWRTGRRRWRARAPSSTCPSTPTCPTTTCPRRPRSWRSTGAWRARPTRRRSHAVRAELLDRFGPLPPPVERLLEVARLRLTAEAAGIASRGARGRPAGRPLRPGLVTRGHGAGHGAAERERPRPGRRRRRDLRLQPDAGAPAARHRGRLAPDALDRRAPRPGAGVRTARIRPGRPTPAGLVGAVLTRDLVAGGERWPKGRRLTAADLRAIAAAPDAGGETTVLLPDPGELHEDDAARRLAAIVGGAGLRRAAAAGEPRGPGRPARRGRLGGPGPAGPPGRHRRAGGLHRPRRPGRPGRPARGQRQDRAPPHPAPGARPGGAPGRGPRRGARGRLPAPAGGGPGQGVAARAGTRPLRGQRAPEGGGARLGAGGAGLRRRRARPGHGRPAGPAGRAPGPSTSS